MLILKSDIQIINVFSHSTGCLITVSLLPSFFTQWNTTCLSLFLLNVVPFVYFCICFLSFSWNYHQDQSHKDFSLCFLPEVLQCQAFYLTL
jgi:hypothetical protein